MRMNRIWLVRIFAIMSMVGLAAMIQDLFEYKRVADLYDTQPCRYSGPQNDRVELAIRRLRELPQRQFCDAVLFQDEGTLVKKAVDELLAEAMLEAGKSKPCKFCLWWTTTELDQLGFDYSDHAFLVAARRYMDP